MIKRFHKPFFISSVFSPRKRLITLKSENETQNPIELFIKPFIHDYFEFGKEIETVISNFISKTSRTTLYMAISALVTIIKNESSNERSFERNDELNIELKYSKDSVLNLSDNKTSDDSDLLTTAQPVTTIFFNSVGSFLEKSKEFLSNLFPTDFRLLRRIQMALNKPITLISCVLKNNSTINRLKDYTIASFVLQAYPG